MFDGLQKAVMCDAMALLSRPLMCGYRKCGHTYGIETLGQPLIMERKIEAHIREAGHKQQRLVLVPIDSVEYEPLPMPLNSGIDKGVFNGSDSAMRVSGCFFR